MISLQPPGILNIFVSFIHSIRGREFVTNGIDCTRWNHLAIAFPKSVMDPESVSMIADQCVGSES